MDDNTLIEYVLKGKTAAFATLIERYKDKVFALALRLSGNRENAEEITQDVFLKIFNSLGNFQRSAKFSTWMYRIAYNTTISKLRSEGRHQNEVGVEDYNQVETFDLIGVLEPLQIDEQKCFLAKALGQLKDDERVLVELYYLEEMNVAEIVEITGESNANVKVKLYRARKKLHDILTRELAAEVQTLY